MCIEIRGIYSAASGWGRIYDGTNNTIIRIEISFRQDKR